MNEPKRVTKEHVDQAIEHLLGEGFLSDTGPQEDGSRTAEQWLNATGEDMAIIKMQLKSSLDDKLCPERSDKAQAVAVALKEANRLRSDIGRFASEVHGLTKEDLDGVGPL